MFSDIGLSEKESKIYLYLVKKGATKARGISRALNIERVQVYRVLKDLQKKGMVESTFEYPASFIAVSFEKVLNLLIEVKKEEAKRLEASKENLMAQLDLHQYDGDETSYKFMILEGKNYIYSKIAQMIQETSKTLAAVTSGHGVIEAYHSGLTDYGRAREEVHFRLLTSLSLIDNYIDVTKEILQEAKKNLCFEIRVGNFEAAYFPRFIIRDKEELLLFLTTTEDDDSASKKDIGLWTNHRILIDTFVVFFESMWCNSKDVLDTIKE